MRWRPGSLLAALGDEGLLRVALGAPFGVASDVFQKGVELFDLALDGVLFGLLFGALSRVGCHRFLPGLSGLGNEPLPSRVGSGSGLGRAMEASYHAQARGLRAFPRDVASRE